MFDEKLSERQKAAVLAHFRARKYLVTNSREAWLMEVAAEQWCLAAGWALVCVNASRFVKKGRWRKTVMLKLKLPDSSWLSPEGHKQVKEYLENIFRWNWPNRRLKKKEGPEVFTHGPYTWTRNLDPFPYSYSQHCRGRDLDSAARGLFALASRHLTPSLKTDCW